MNEKIKGHQLERGAYVLRASINPRIRCAITWRARNGSMPSHHHASPAGFSQGHRDR